MRCPNCNERYKRVKDKYYAVRIVHDNPLCPYGFDYAHHTPELLRPLLQKLLEGLFPWFDAKRSMARSKIWEERPQKSSRT